VESVPARHDLRILALGPAQVFREGRELVAADWTFAKPKELLFYLVANPPQTKEQIGAIFWPEASPTQLRQSFRTTMYHLRQALGRREWVLFEKGRYGFNRALDYVYDVAQFEAQLEQADALQASDPERAIHLLRETTDLYRGAYIADITLDDWAVVRRRELERKYVQALLSLGRLLSTRSDYFQAEQVYRRIVDEDPLVEAAHRGLMRCYAGRGEQGLALRQYQRLVDLLQEALGTSPSTESETLYARIGKDQDASG
jgi:DNA-binding SARP family transcriptional activator